MASRDQALAARERRIARWDIRLEWYGERVRGNVRMGIQERLKLTAQLLRDKVVINISIPVVKIRKKITITDPDDGRRKRVTRTVVDPDSRSKPGEYPRADTTRLMKDIFWDLRPDLLRARVGTTLDYGYYLEMRMQRSFLRRTLYEVRDRLMIVLITDAGAELPGQDYLDET